MPRSRKDRSRTGQGMRPGTAMALCVAFTLLLGAALWHTGRGDAPPPPPPGVTDSAAAAEAAGLADQQAALVLDEDDRIESTVFGRRPGRTPHGPPTTKLRPAAAPYTLRSLIALGAARRVDPTTVEIITSVLVMPGATLAIDAPGTTLRLASDPGGFVSLVGWGGAIELTGTAEEPLTITSWDPAAAGPDRVPTDGRAYVRIIGGDLSTTGVRFSDLGFWSGRTGGVAITGIADRVATGTLAATEVHDSYYGLYTADAGPVTITDGRFARNISNGVHLHRGSTTVVLERTVAEANGGDGIIADRGSTAVVLRQVVSGGNAGDGIRFDGQPLADQPGPAGASLVGHGDFRIEDSISRDNRGDGVQAIDADDLVISGTQVAGHQNGIVLTGPTARAQLVDNQVSGAVTAGIAVRGGPTQVVAERNEITGGALGLQVRDAQVDLRDNVVTGATGHGISIVGAANGSSATGNSLSGAGRSALDTARLAPGAVVVLDANRDDGWDVRIPPGEYVTDLVRDHPLLPLWAIVLLLPVALLLVRRRLRRAARPYEAGTEPTGSADETQLVPASLRGGAAAPRRPHPSGPVGLPGRPAGPPRGGVPAAEGAPRISPTRPIRSKGAGLR